MDQRQTHFEIFCKRDPKSDWALVEAVPDRERAQKTGHSLFEKHPKGAVRVEKEIYDPETGGYQTVSILTLGDAGPASNRDKTTEPPCSLPEDLHSLHARHTIARVLQDWLSRLRVTPLELLHRGDLAEKLDGEGTMLQHAIQKTAMAQAAEYEANVQHFMKRLNDLTERAIGALLERERNGKLARIGSDGFGALADRLGEKSSYQLRAAVAHALKSAGSWPEKIAMLLQLAASLEGREMRETGLAVIEEYLAEILAVEEAADTLTGKVESIGERLEIFVALIGGFEDQTPTRPARVLAGYFAAKELRAARGALIARVLTELRRPQRLNPGNFWEEVALSRKLADRMIAMAGPDMPPEDVAEVFVYRSGRLVQAEAIDEALEGAQDSGRKIEALMELERALAGPMAKKKLASYLRAQLGANKTEAELVTGPGKPLARAAKLARLQALVLKSGLPAEEKGEIAATIDRMCMKALSNPDVFQALANGSAPPLDRAKALLKLAAGGGLTRGRCQAEASIHAQTLLRKAVQSGAATPGALAEIKTLLNEAAAAA